MPRVKQPTNYTGGSLFTRARQQFQVLYEREGSFQRALGKQELILWPTLLDSTGNPVRPPESILESWARDVDEGKADIPPKVRQAFNARYDSYTEALTRDALEANALTVKALAQMAREGTLSPDRSAHYAHANNGLGFLVKELIGRRVAEPQKRLRGMKVLAASKKEPIVDAEFRALPSP